VGVVPMSDDEIYVWMLERDEGNPARLSSCGWSCSASAWPASAGSSRPSRGRCGPTSTTAPSTHCSSRLRGTAAGWC
jgi:hypothetical protein